MNISEEHTASHFSIEDGDSVLLPHAGTYKQTHMALPLRRPILTFYQCKNLESQNNISF
jgi:hypothetical protein